MLAILKGLTRPKLSLDRVRTRNSRDEMFLSNRNQEQSQAKNVFLFGRLTTINRWAPFQWEALKIRYVQRLF